MRSSLLLGLALVACGGSGASDDLFSGGGAAGGPGTASTSTSAPPSSPPTSPTSTPPGTPTTTPCAVTKYYRDRDGDGFGNSNETKSSCTSPGKEWLTKGGDCNDEDPDVFPGQTAYFTQPYQQNGKLSFDYDCSGNEDQSAPVRDAASTCAPGIMPGTCTGSGYLPPDPARPKSAGVDQLCGAARYQSCKFLNGGQGGGACQAVVSNDVLPTACR